jgi:hypothetical protein
MTDVPALSLALLALAFYGRAVRSRKLGWLALAAVVATLAATTRQNTVVVAVVAAVLLGRASFLRGRPVWWLGVLLPVAAGLGVHFWFQGRPDVRATKFELLAPAHFLQLPFVAIHFAGLTVLPLLLLSPLLLAPRAESLRRFAWAFGLMQAFAGYWYLYGVYLPYGGLFPYTDNMLTPHGAFAGSRLSGGLLVVGDRPVLVGIAGRVFLSFLGCLAGALLVVRVFEQRRKWNWDNPLLLFTLLQLPFLLLVPAIYDRYLLFLLPGALLLAAPPKAENGPLARWQWGASLAALIGVGIVSVALMHDWLAWNAARWQLGRRAVEQGHIHPLSIEGGVEWDGWHALAGGNAARPDRPRWPVLPFTRDWFPSITGRYCLSFSQLPGARLVDSEPYSLWLLPGPRRFYLLELPPLPADAPPPHRDR